MILISAISIIVAKAKYLSNGDNVLIDLKNNIDSFYEEAQIIDEIKCHLINYKNLDDYYNANVYIYETNNGYELIFNGEDLLIEVKEGIITDYDYR